MQINWTCNNWRTEKKRLISWYPFLLEILKIQEIQRLIPRNTQHAKLRSWYNLRTIKFPLVTPPPPILKSFWIHACVLTFKLKMIKRGSVIVLLNNTISYNILLNIRYYILYCIVYFDYIWYRLIYHMIQHDIISYDTIWSHIKLNNVILHHIIFTMYDIVLYQLI